MFNIIKVIEKWNSRFLILNNTYLDSIIIKLKRNKKLLILSLLIFEKNSIFYQVLTKQIKEVDE